MFGKELSLTIGFDCFAVIFGDALVIKTSVPDLAAVLCIAFYLDQKSHRFWLGLFVV